MIYLAELGERIRLFRRKKGMTQRALAERLHVSTQAISSWELGVSYPDIENLCRLSEVLSVSVDALLVKGDTKEETYMIGIDGGGTKSEYALFSPSGQVKRTFCLSGTNAATKGVDEAVNILCRGIDICMDASVSVSHIFLGNAGSHYEELRRALDAPEQYHHLIVRVGGYSDYFVNLPEGLQDNVIARTMNSI